MKVSDGGGISDENENIKVMEISFSTTVQMVEIKDAKTIMLVQYAQINSVFI